MLNQVHFGKDFGTFPGLESRILRADRESTWSHYNTVYRFFSTTSSNQPIDLAIEINFEVLSTAVDTVVYEGKIHSVYPFPGRPEFGVIIRQKLSDATEWNPINHNGMPNTATSTTTFSASNNQYLNLTLQIQSYFVWLGPTPAPSTIPNTFGINGLILLHFRSHKIINDIVTWKNHNEYPPGSNYYKLHYTVVPHKFRLLGTCTTPSNIPVKLPMVWQSEFTAIDTTRGDTPFNLTFTNCNQYMNSIHYKMYSTNPADNTSNPNALISLNSSSTASGIKVQVLDGNTSQPIELDQFKVALPYQSNNSITSFTIPFTARYYQTEPTVTPGTVRATVLFQIIYQ